MVGYRPVTIKTTTQRIVQVGSYTETLCTEYTYVRVNNTTYAVTSGGWTDAGYYEGYSAPNDTADTHYEFVRVNWDVCGDTCTNHPYLVYKVYKRTLVQKAADNSDSVSRTCSATTTRTIPLYAIQTTTETYNEKQYVYGYVKRYRYRECATYQEASTQYAWSTSQNDQSLLNQGYTLTGNKREKSK